MKRYGIISMLFLFFISAAAEGAEKHGLISVEDYYSKDSSVSYGRHFLTTRIRLDMTKLNEGNAGFHFDGRMRNNLGSEEYSGAVKNERIDELNLDYNGERLYLAAGRLWPKELYIEKVDGINAVYQKKGKGVGVFAGARPDPNTETFSPDYTAAGAYGFIRNDRFSGSLAFTHNGYKGGTDRQYIYGQASWFPVQTLMLYTTLTADVNQKKKKVDLTNGVIELTYRPDAKKSVTVGYNQFQAFRYYKSSTVEVDYSKQRAFYLSGNYRLTEKFMVYGRAEKQSMSYPSADGNRDSKRYRAGVNGDNLLNKGINVDVSFTLVDSYGSKNNAYSLEVSRLNWEILQLAVFASYMENQYAGSADSDTILTYGASGYLIIDRKWNVSVLYEEEKGQDYTAMRLISRAGYNF